MTATHHAEVMRSLRLCREAASLLPEIWRAHYFALADKLEEFESRLVRASDSGGEPR